MLALQNEHQVLGLSQSHKQAAGVLGQADPELMWVTKDVQPWLLFPSLPLLVTQGCLDYAPTKPRCVCALRGPPGSIQSLDAAEHLLDNHRLVQFKPASYLIWGPM